jgi:Domain of unknown function (DUF2828)
MNTFANAVANQEARTENGMKARKNTGSSVLDLFFKVGASRGQNIVPQFVSAVVEDEDRALRIALWARDIRGGAGERKVYRDILAYLAKNDVDKFKALARKTPELGRWDDLLEVAVGPEVTVEVRNFVFDMIKEALAAGNGLCAKWMPRKGVVANTLRNYFEWTPKFYRKRLVELTNVVETKMCAQDWENINFNHVPSVAASRYKKAFKKHSVAFEEYVKKLAEGDKDVKVNASSIFPYDVLKAIINKGFVRASKTEIDHAKAQWDALPNYVGDANVLPIVDVSGSMGCQVSPGLTALDVSISLCLYLADKNKGKFKDTFLTFSGRPELVTLKGNIAQKVEQMSRSHWDMNTDLHAALDKILDVAVKGSVPQEEMPAILLILSDMQFDACVRYDDSAIEMIARKYEAAGYNVPNVVFWNLNSRDNVPAKLNDKGVALVSGFSPAIAKSVLKADATKFTPEGIMDATIMVPRYDWAA